MQTLKEAATGDENANAKETTESKKKNFHYLHNENNSFFNPCSNMLSYDIWFSHKK